MSSSTGEVSSRPARLSGARSEDPDFVRRYPLGFVPLIPKLSPNLNDAELGTGKDYSQTAVFVTSGILIDFTLFSR